LKEHWEAGIPAYVLVGVGKEMAWYPYPDFDGSVYRKDVISCDKISDLVHDMQRRMNGISTKRF
jgi:hypothetical protein